jgi:hypothetical protein
MLISIRGFVKRDLKRGGAARLRSLSQVGAAVKIILFGGASR